MWVGSITNDPTTCQTLTNVFDGHELELKRYYSKWDVGGQRLGFAPTVNTYLQLA